MNKKPVSAQQLNNLLPQTQCQLCAFEGCLPYAKAMAQGQAPINKCLPGGVRTLQALGQATGVDPTPHIEAMNHDAKAAQRVRIDETACIGCTKCIQACPVDAILGRSKHMHSIIPDECSGCELCIDPCPVDCIHTVPIPEPSPMTQRVRARQYQHRYEQRQARLKRKPQTSNHTPLDHTTRQHKVANRKSDIAAILARQSRKPTATENLA